MAFGDLGAGIGAGIGSLATLFGAAGEGGEDERLQALQLWQNLQVPEYDMQSLVAPQYQIAAQRTPETYSPEFYSTTPFVPQDSPGSRASQERSLSKLEEFRDEGMPLAEKLRANELGRQMAQEYSGLMNYGTDVLQRRGQFGGAAQAQMQAAAGQQGANRAGQFGAELAAMSEQNRYRGAQDAFGAASGLRGQDFGIASDQSNALQRFNEWYSGMLTQGRADAAGARERAQASNVGRTQDVADRNVAARYGTSLDNLNRQNQLRGQSFGDQVTRLSGVTGQLGERSRERYGEQAANRDNIVGLASGFGGAAGGLYDFANAGNAQRTREDEERRARQWYR